MGTPIAPSYASTFMGSHETKLLDGYPLKPLIWLRFLDDVFVLFTHGQDEFTKFVDYLNSKHEKIKFTMEQSLEQVNFLDTTVIVDKDTRKLYTTVYSKPTDTHDYLHFTSSHPDHCKTGGPKGQLLRLRRICTKDDDFEENCEKMTEHYLRRGYPKRIMKKHVEEVRKLKQDDLLQVKDKDEGQTRMTLTLEYNPANPDILGIINDSWDLLECSPKMNKLFEHKPMLAHKRAPNIRDMLVRATTNYPSETDSNEVRFDCNAKRCRRRNCPLCPKAPLQGHIKSHVTKESYRTTNNVSCETLNVIYCLTCKQCGKQYVGETKRSFRIRVSEHQGDVRNQRNQKPVARHYNSKHHSLKCMSACILEVLTRDPSLSSTTSIRREREEYWLYRLRSLDPLGLNSMG
jgi:hypothetical protein